MEKGNRKIINAWAMYDWANSVYSLVITSSVFQIYYSAVVDESVDIFGLPFYKNELYAYHLSAAFLTIAIVSPMLSAIADYGGLKKRFMQFFAYLGSLACIGLYFFEGTENIEYGLMCSMLASIGFSGSIVFYNAFLPEIADKEDQDRVSAKGYALGYIGSVLLLAFNLSMIMMPDLYGIDPENGKLAPKISFLTVGVWWIVFSQIPFYYLPNNVFGRKITGNLLFRGYGELRGVWKEFSELPQLRTFLVALFLYNAGVQTVMYMATTFGKDELNLDDSILIPTIMLIQFFGIAGAFGFSAVSKKLGNVKALMIIIATWILICYAAYLITGAASFMTVGVIVGFVMGAVQSLSRSTYSKMLPETMSHASYFSFYDVMEKLSTVFGTATFGFVVALSGGGMRNSVFVLSVYFILALVLLNQLRKMQR